MGLVQTDLLKATSMRWATKGLRCAGSDSNHGEPTPNQSVKSRWDEPGIAKLAPMPERNSRDYEAIAESLGGHHDTLLPGHLGLEIVELAEGRARMRCEIRQHHLANNGYLHAGSVVTLADTTAGFGCVANFPEGATGFTTMELKTNFLGTLLEGAMVAEGRMVHGGRTTQVWDVDVSDEATGRALALFRCTQLLIYPRA